MRWNVLTPGAVKFVFQEMLIIPRKKKGTAVQLDMCGILL